MKKQKHTFLQLSFFNKCLKFILPVFFSFATIISEAQSPLFAETYDEAETSTTGNSAEGIAWTASCPTCVVGDYFHVISTGNTLTAEDTNGPATFEFMIPDASLSSYSEFDFSLNFTASNTNYESSGANQDYIMVEYKFGAGAFVLLDSLNGNNIKNNVISISNTPIVSGNLTFKITVQNWAHAETIKFDDIAVLGRSPLPVELSFFNGHQNQAGQVELSWTTLSETNNEMFVLEKRNLNTQRFNKIGEMEGAGNSGRKINYSFIDENPSPGVNYYRLRQIDWDGSSTKSKVISINIEQSGNTKLYPTATSNVINVLAEGFTNSYQIKLLDINGNILENKMVEDGESNTIFNVNHLASGHYFININSNGKSQTMRFFRL